MKNCLAPCGRCVGPAHRRAVWGKRSGGHRAPAHQPDLEGRQCVVTPRAKDTQTGILKKGTTPLTGRLVTLEKRTYGTKALTLVTTKTTNSKGRSS